MNNGTPRSSDEDVRVLMGPERTNVPFYHQQQPASQFRFYLTDDIEEPDRYHQMCQVLRQATERDQVYIHLNSGGGRLDSTVQIIAAMRESKAEVVTVADGVVASAATLLFLAGDGYIVNPHCLFMVHNFSGGAYGKGHELESQIFADIKWFTRIANDLYEGFLTKAEARKVFKGEDYWFTADEVMTRLARRIEHMRTVEAASQQGDTKTSLESIGQHLTPYLSEAQAKQIERLVKCAVKNMEKQDEEAAQE